MPTLSKRTENFTDSIIRRMTRISNQYNAINLSQGFPDFKPPGRLPIRWRESLPKNLISMPSPGEPRISAKHWPAR